VSAKLVCAALRKRFDRPHVRKTHFVPKNGDAPVDLWLVDADLAGGGVQVSRHVSLDVLLALGARRKHLTSEAVALRLTLAMRLGELTCRVVDRHRGARRVRRGAAAVALAGACAKTQRGEKEKGRRQGRRVSGSHGARVCKRYAALAFARLRERYAWSAEVGPLILCRSATCSFARASSMERGSMAAAAGRSTRPHFAKRARVANRGRRNGGNRGSSVATLDV